MDVAWFQTGEFSETSRHSALSPLLRHLGEDRDAAGVGGILAGQEAAVGQRAFEMVGADVIGPPLEQGDPDRRLQRIAHHRQILVEELVLQGLGAGGNDHLAARPQRRHQIGESLARAGPRLGDEDRTAVDGGGDALGHVELLVAHAITADRLRQRAVGRKNFREGSQGETPEKVGRILADERTGIKPVGPDVGPSINDLRAARRLVQIDAHNCLRLQLRENQHRQAHKNWWHNRFIPNPGTFMPTISQFFGIVIQMFWREHAPPHFHALYGEHEAQIDIRTLDVCPLLFVLLILADHDRTQPPDDDHRAVRRTRALPLRHGEDDRRVEGSRRSADEYAVGEADRQSQFWVPSPAPS